MRIHRKGSEGQRVKVSKRIKFILLFFSLIFSFSLLASHFSLSHAQGISDIKLDVLNEPVKEKWGRDPFIRYGDKMTKVKGAKVFGEDETSGLKISGIISDGKKAVAIINGGFYRKNDRIGDFLISDIAKERVTLEKKGKRFYLGVEQFAIGGGGKDKSVDDKKDKDRKDDSDKDKKEDKEGKK